MIYRLIALFATIGEVIRDANTLRRKMQLKHRSISE
jgi:hypothetical protein